MGKFVHWLTLILLTVIALFAGAANWLLGWSFWAVFGLVTFGILLIGLFALLEDEQPGGVQ